MSGQTEGSVIFKRAKGPAYRISCARAELYQVARETRPLPREFINKAGNGITDAFRRYAMPLTGGLPRIGKLF